jgi:hypothetical protein
MTAFYCVADERYFLGAVGLVNSLRLVGHTERIFLLDCGLTAEQRELLSGEAVLVAAGGDTPPWLLKTVLPLRHPAEAMVLIDADMIVTRRLDELIETASRGGVVAIENYRDRHVAEWGELLGLGPVRRQPYVSSGLVTLDAAMGERILGLMDELQGKVEFELTFWRRDVRRYPFRFGDQDVLNAILASERVPRGCLEVVESRLGPTPPYRGIRVLDEGALRCGYADGVEPYLLHQYIRKPWLDVTYHGAYSRLLVRLLAGDDVAIRVPAADVPVRLGRGMRGRLLRGVANVRDAARWHLGDPLVHLVPEGLKNRIDSRRHRRVYP